jgi:hypothetical protein
VLRGVAAALVHLAGRGIVHGDVYGHNTLVATGPSAGSLPALLTDFGAAWFMADAAEGGFDQR